MPSNVINTDSPSANMYGCEPCPNCGDKFRCVFQSNPDVIQCDHCGYSEGIDLDRKEHTE
jgi:hypothetical protein